MRQCSARFFSNVLNFGTPRAYFCGEQGLNATEWWHSPKTAMMKNTKTNDKANDNGNNVIETILKVIKDKEGISEGLRAVEEVTYEIKEANGKIIEEKEISRAWGFVNEAGEMRIPPIYAVVWNFKGGLAKVCQKGKWGMINKCGETVVPIECDALYEASDGMLQVQVKGRWGCLKKDGTTVVKPRYDYIFPFRFGFAAIKKDGKYGFVNLEAQEVIAPCFDEVGLIAAGGVVRVRNGSQWKELRL